MESNVLFPGVKVGETFTVGGIEFIRFPEMDGGVPAVAKDLVFRSVFGKTTNLAESEVLRRLQEDVLPKIEAEVGAENLLPIHTDLTALDGLKPYPVLESRVSLPTFDFYRKNVELFDRYPVDRWWWLATPDCAPPHSGSPWVVCVAPGGDINVSSCYYGRGVRPFCIFHPSIFDSCAA